MGRQILYHCATWETLLGSVKINSYVVGWVVQGLEMKQREELNCEATVIKASDDPSQEPGLVLQVKESESVSCSVVSNSLGSHGL